MTRIYQGWGWDALIVLMGCGGHFARFMLTQALVNSFGVVCVTPSRAQLSPHLQARAPTVHSPPRPHGGRPFPCVTKNPPFGLPTFVLLASGLPPPALKCPCAGGAGPAMEGCWTWWNDLIPPLCTGESPNRPIASGPPFKPYPAKSDKGLIRAFGSIKAAA